ncbi:MAG: hypothetical protein K0B11_22770, partial [Mariniphaga sp.]|nr:hypothetical protein [Mariniphaga sp.]
EDTELIRDILAQPGLADVKTFGLYWEDCDNMMKKLGYTLKIDAGLVSWPRTASTGWFTSFTG